ncbi:hypothetical protein ADS78_12930, partial [Idiomarina abyssalis]
DVAIGIGRTIMQHVERAPLPVFAQFPVEIHLAPALDEFRFLGGQASAHRKIGLRQIKCLRIVEWVGGVGHFSSL